MNFWLNFTNKLGTAAGLDKNGDFIDCLGSLGFGFLKLEQLHHCLKLGILNQEFFDYLKSKL